MGNTADFILHSASVIDPGAEVAGDSVAVAGNRIIGVGSRERLQHAASPHTRWISCQGRSILPGLIDGHAHMDREGLKDMLPSLEGARCVDDILEIVRREANGRRPGEWIVTMPVGTPPLYLDGAESLREKRWPDRHDLDRAAPDNPVYIRPIWGYWSNRPPLVSVANTRALRMAGIQRETPAPSPDVDILRDPSTGEPTGVFRENTRMSIVEMTLMAAAPHFQLSDRIAALRTSMAAYNAFGTTAVYEGHGTAAEVISAYQAVRDEGRQTVRATLVISPSWTPASGADDIRRMLRDWAGWASRAGFGDDWVRIQGIYAEQDESHEGRLRATAAPQTGWAGFNYDSGLPRKLLRELLLEAARNRMRVSTIFPEVSGLFPEIHARIPIDGFRWARGHINVMGQSEIDQLADLGIVLVTHTNRHIAKLGSQHLHRLGDSRQNDIVPLRRLVDSGVQIALGSDNLPPSLFHPITDVVFRRDRTTGEVIAPDQALSRQEAFSLASQGGAWLLGREHELGRVSEGYLADLTVLDGNVLTLSESALRNASAHQVYVDGRPVLKREPDETGSPAEDA